MDVAALLSHEARRASSVTAATLFRVMDEVHPTLIIDEMDETLRSHNPDLYAVFNGSHSRVEAKVWRNVKEGDDWVTKEFWPRRCRRRATPADAWHPTCGRVTAG
jgi:hypothetical protein